MALVSTSLNQIIYHALRDIGCLMPGQTTSVDVLGDGLRAANQLIDSWQLESLDTLAYTQSLYSLTASQQTYTIGPSEVAPNFTAARPIYIQEASIIQNTQSPPTRIPLKIFNVAQRAQIAVDSIPNSIPIELYYDRGYSSTGYGTIFLWPGPLSSAYQLELFTSTQLHQFADGTTSYAFPPGYQRMLQKWLAVEMAPMMRVYFKLAGLTMPPQMGELVAQVRAQAEEAKMMVQSYNSPPCEVATDPAYCNGTGGGFDYQTGLNSQSRRR